MLLLWFLYRHCDSLSPTSLFIFIWKCRLSYHYFNRLFRLHLYLVLCQTSQILMYFNSSQITNRNPVAETIERWTINYLCGQNVGVAEKAIGLLRVTTLKHVSCLTIDLLLPRIFVHILKTDCSFIIYYLNFIIEFF